jgi:hypothetical protein
MSGEFDLKDANAMLDAARKARSEMVIFHHDSQVPGEVSSLARLFWRHIPEMAKRAGAQIEDKEGHPEGISSSDQSLIKMVSADMVHGRGVVEWLARVTSDQTKAMFKKGADNAMEGFIQEFAKARGIVREDALAMESGAFAPEKPVEEVKKPAQLNKAFAFSRHAGMGL